MPSSIAYLVNQYPSPSHSFIRREIVELERLDWHVHRFSHRRSSAKLVDRADQDELAQTTILLDNPARLVCSVLTQLFRAPVRTAKALGLALQMAHKAGNYYLKHIGYFSLACLMVRYMGRLNLTHLHAHFAINPADVAYLCHALCGTKYSFTIHATYEYEDPENRLNLAEKILGAEFVVVVSLHALNYLSQKFPEHRQKFKLVRCGLDSRWLDRKPTPNPESNTLLCIARLEPQKNPELLIKAAKQLLQSGYKFKLVFIGDGQLRARIEQQIRLDGLDHIVTLTGWCNQQTIQHHLLGARALVFASRSEGIPVAIMEAFACGRPAIAPSVGGVNELVEEGVTGWLYPQGDLTALKAAIVRCLTTEPVELQNISTKGNSRVSSYDIKHSAKTLIEHFSLSDAT